MHANIEKDGEKQWPVMRTPVKVAGTNIEPRHNHRTTAHRQTPRSEMGLCAQIRAARLWVLAMAVKVLVHDGEGRAGRDARYGRWSSNIGSW